MLTKLLTSDEAFEWDVRVPFDPARYDSRTILSMVKAANRRGRVRWFQHWEDGEEERWISQTTYIVGEDDLPSFVRDMTDSEPKSRRRRYPEPDIYVAGSLVVSFEDRSDARALTKDLARLVVRDDADQSSFAASPRLQMIEQSKGYPSFKGTDPLNLTVEFKDAWLEDPAAIDAWFRSKIKHRYRVALWCEENGTFDVMRFQPRYWRLNAKQWHHALSTTEPFASGLRYRLLVNFESKKDALLFKLTHG